MPEPVQDVETGVQGDTTDADLPEVVTPQNLGRMWASSMGMSFAVPADVDALSAKITWGRYEKRESGDEEGRKRSVWVREPVAHAVEVRLDGKTSARVPLTADHPPAFLTVPRGLRLPWVNPAPELLLARESWGSARYRISCQYPTSIQRLNLKPVCSKCATFLNPNFS